MLVVLTNLLALKEGEMAFSLTTGYYSNIMENNILKIVTQIKINQVTIFTTLYPRMIFAMDVFE